MSKGLVLAEIGWLWALKRAALITGLMAIGWFGGKLAAWVWG